MSEVTEIFIGRLGKKPDLRYTPNRIPVCNLSVAIDQENDEGTIWKRVLVWGKQAEICPLYLKKGEEIFIQGKAQIKAFVNKEGKRIEYEEITAKLIGFLNI